jgi:DNA invertase Pin-like site-specific DNA recombinase
MIQEAIGYIRVSTEEQAAEGVSLEAQERRIRAYAEMTGVFRLLIIEDRGVSASVPLIKRPGGAKVVAALASGDYKNVITLKLDRLFRDTIDGLSMVKDWDRREIGLHIIDLGGNVINTKTAAGQFMITVLAGVAEMERNMISERTSAALQYKKGQGEIYGPVPYGKVIEDGRLVEDPYERAVLRDIQELREVHGASYRLIAWGLNECRIPTKQGGTWHPGTVRYMLKH